jgi:hypothetical protein
VELVVARHLFDERTIVALLEDNEVADQVEEAALLEHAAQNNLKLGEAGCVVRARDGAPGLEPFLPGAERTDPRLNTVGGDEHDVRCEERRDLRLVGLKLAEGRPDVRVLVRGVLQFDDGERQAVDEENDSRIMELLRRNGLTVERKPEQAALAAE